MQKPKYFLRYRAIIQKLRISKEATFQEIKDYLERQLIQAKNEGKSKPELYSFLSVPIVIGMRTQPVPHLWSGSCLERVMPIGTFANLFRIGIIKILRK